MQDNHPGKMHHFGNDNERAPQTKLDLPHFYQADLNMSSRGTLWACLYRTQLFSDMHTSTSFTFVFLSLNLKITLSYLPALTVSPMIC